MITISQEQFFNLQTSFTQVPFTQSLGWHTYVNADNAVYFVDSLENPKIGCWGVINKIPLTSKSILRVDGECITDEIKEGVYKLFFEELTKQPYHIIEINSNNRYDIAYEIGIRQGGFKRPIGFFSCPLTIELDLTANFNFNRNWKRNVKKAVSEDLIFKEIDVIDTSLVKAIIKMFDEMAKLKSLGFSLSQDNLLTMLKSPDMRAFMVFDKEGEPIAARIIHVFKNGVSDVFAANSINARNCGATYFIMERIFEILKQEGFRFFDFGRIPPSNHATNSVYTFKNASRGHKIQYNGEWTYSKSSSLEFLLFLYKVFKLKKQRY